MSAYKIAENLGKGVSDTLTNKKIHDFEDGLEHYAAQQQGYYCIITEDIEDFYFSEIEVLSCLDFFKRYLIVN